MYAVIASGGKQEKVAEGQQVRVELLDADEGSDVSLTPVMVVDGSTVEARGGAFEDMFSKCDVALEKPHAGTADKATGFRVVLDLDS